MKMTRPRSSPMFAKEGRVIKNVSKMVRKFLALWMSLSSLPSLKIRSKEALLPILLRSFVWEVKLIMIREKSKTFQASEK